VRARYPSGTVRRVFGRLGKVALGATAATLVLGLLSLTPPAAAAGKVHRDQACLQTTIVGSWSNTLTQTFTPAVGTITRWQVVLGSRQDFTGTITSRLVLHPAASAFGAAVGGVVLATAQTFTTFSAFHFATITFVPAAPVSVVTGLPTGSYSIEVDDSPLSVGTNGVSVPTPPPFLWIHCGTDYRRGGGYAGVDVPVYGAMSQPTVLLSDTSTTGYVFADYGY